MLTMFELMSTVSPEGGSRSRGAVPTQQRLLTVREVADAMRVSNMTVYRLIKAGQLAGIRVGKNYRIRESDVNRYLSDRSVRVEAGE